MNRRAAVAMFFGSAAMFALEPTLARMILPHAGGGPSVWTACLVFFQIALLVGYLAAHAVATRLGPKAQVVVILGVLALGLAFMPVALPDRATSSTVGVLGILALAAGVPFVALATIAPTLQRWEHAAEPEREPYVLYAASNAGSLVALVAYPLVEPFVGLRTIARGVMALYAVLFVAVALAAVRRWRAPAEAVVIEEPVKPALAARWALLAFVPAAYLAAVTTQVTVEFAPMPLVWVIPLALYIVTFIVAFAGGARAELRAKITAYALPFTTAIVVFLLVTKANAYPLVLGAIHFGAFFVAAFACHAELARLRPPGTQATAYYVALAAGGAAGSLFVALVAPRLFTQYLEYPLLVLAAIAVAPGVTTLPPDRRRDFGFALAVAVVAFGAWHFSESSRGLLAALIFPGVPLLLALVGFRHRRRYALAIAFILGIAGAYTDDRTFFRERGFFGTLRVARDGTGKFVVLVHGTTIHGRQAIDPAQRREPLTYYARSGPAGDVFALARREQLGDVIVVGLGAGTLAAYAMPIERWTFIEIDPAVVRIANDRRYFTYLADAFPGGANVREGDARVVLRGMDRSAGLLVVDAFSGDAIPTHLLTVEAGKLYAERASVVAFHVSNRHADLVPIVGRLASAMGWAATERDDSIILDDDTVGKSASDWVVIAPSRALLSDLGNDWNPVDDDGKPAWTDDATSVITILR